MRNGLLALQVLVYIYTEGNYLCNVYTHRHRTFLRHLMNMGIIGGNPPLVIAVRATSTEIKRTVSIIRRYCTKTNTNKIGIHNLQVQKLLALT